MKILSFIGKSLLLVLLASASQADISLTLGNKQYLPPPIQELPIEDSNTQQRQKVEEKKYGNSKYQIFEIHNHYEPLNFKGEENNYSGLQKKFAKEIRIEHINAPKGFPLDDPSLDASYLSIAAGNDKSNKQIIVQHEIKTNIPVPFPSNYRHSFSEKSNKEHIFGAVQQSFSSVEHHQGQQHAIQKFMGPEYLPPKSQPQEYSINPVQNSFAKPIHETSHQFERKRSEDRFKGPDHGLLTSQHNTAFKGPGYLPPVSIGNFGSPGSSHSHENLSQNTPFGVHNSLQSNHHSSVQSEQQFVTKTQFKDSDYLPPPFKGPEYLPPQQSESKAAFKDPDYLPPVGTGVEQHQLLVESLPLGYDFQKPPNAEQAIAELHKLPEESLDLHTQVAGQVQSSNINPNTPELSDTKDVLQSGHDFQKPQNSEQAINLLQNEAITTNIEPFKVSGYSLPVYHFQKTFNQLHEVDSPKQQNLPDNDFQKLPNGEQVVSQLHGQQSSYGANQAPLTRNGQNSGYLPPTTGSQAYNGPQTLTGRNYLSSNTFSQNSKELLPPEQTGTYFPSTTPTNNHVLNPLSSYMSNVKPYDRYGNRRPFSEYGLPFSKTSTFFSSNGLSPMYSEPASRPQFYAPTMSYTNNAFNSQTFATYAQKQHQSAPVFSHSNAKIRTVQIFNPPDSKTLKVLESLDNAGVKTIKILGPSNEQPMGDHRVVKVVSGSYEQNVQTVKIFNDHQDVTSNANGALTVEKSNSYLPPRGKRNSNNKTKT